MTKYGAGELKAFDRNRGLRELRDDSYLNHIHDLEVTNIRILFHELGYTQWLSERTLSKFYGLRRIPDGMIFYQDKYIAIEYEASLKAKRRYQRIFLDYELDRQVNKVLYVTDTPEILQKVLKEAGTYDKLYFVSLKDLQRDRMNTKLIKPTSSHTLHEFFHFDFKT